MEVLQVFIEVLQVVIQATLTGVGLWLAYSYQRQLRIRVEEQRLTAYRALWSTMGSATPVRLTQWIARPLTRGERRKLFQELTAWYYHDGNGMFLGDSTRAVYLRVKDNLLCPIECYEPASIRNKLLELPPASQDDARGYLSIRHLSLLRSRMKADLEVYGLPYHTELDEDDKALLRSLNEDLAKKPWADRGRGVVSVCPNVHIWGNEDVQGS